jgi:hypothetical protein
MAFRKDPASGTHTNTPRLCVLKGGIKADRDTTRKPSKRAREIKTYLYFEYVFPTFFPNAIGAFQSWGRLLDYTLDLINAQFCDSSSRFFPTIKARLLSFRTRSTPHRAC